MFDEHLLFYCRKELIYPCKLNVTYGKGIVILLGKGHFSMIYKFYLFKFYINIFLVDTVRLCEITTFNIQNIWFTL